MSNNPLSKYFRKPTYYMQLPTKGTFNPEFDQTALDEIPILPMTTMDELSLKNPDALLNGEAIIDVIASCVPSIPNPRNICNIDAEALFLGIRQATYGSELEQEHKCSNCGETNSYTIDIGYILSQYPEVTSEPVIEFDDLKIYLRPPSINSISRLALIKIEQDKMLRDIMKVATREDELPNEAETLTIKYQESFNKITEYNLDLLSASVNFIETPDGTVSDHLSINEFIRNVPSTLVDEINEKVKEISGKPQSAEKMQYNCPECGTTDEVGVEINPVNFSVAG